MSKLLPLRVLVNERLTAAAEEIFVLFERTIAEYEKELCRSERENQRKQRLLDQVNPRVLLPRAGLDVQSLSASPPHPGLIHKVTEAAQMKEEPGDQNFVKQEEEQLPVSVPKLSAVYVKREEPSLFQPQDGEISSEPHFLHETEEHTDQSPHTDNDDDWKPPFSCSGAQMDTEVDKDHCYQIQTRDRGTTAQNSGQSPQYKSAPGTSVHVEHASVTDERAEMKKHQCPFCKKLFTTNRNLQIHIRVHTGERPYSCPICHKKLTQKGNLKIHIRTHTNEKPYSCSICMKTFARKDCLDIHRRIHTGERPYSCPFCSKGFNQSSNLRQHMKTHMKSLTKRSQS